MHRVMRRSILKGISFFALYIKEVVSTFSFAFFYLSYVLFLFYSLCFFVLSSFLPSFFSFCPFILLFFYFVLFYLFLYFSIFFIVLFSVFSVFFFHSTVNFCYRYSNSLQWGLMRIENSDETFLMHPSNVYCSHLQKHTKQHMKHQRQTFYNLNMK